MGAARAVTPFTCFRTTIAATTTDFYDFILTRGYLNSTDRQWILQNADATDASWEGGGRETLTTEFSYEGTVFMIGASANKGRVRRNIVSIVTDTGSYRPSNFLGQLTPRVYYQENF